MADLSYDFGDDDDLDLQIQIEEEENKQLQLQAQAQQAAPVEQAPVQQQAPISTLVEDPGMIDRVRHIAGGGFKTGFGMMNLPNMLQGLVGSGLDSVMPTPELPPSTLTEESTPTDRKWWQGTPEANRMLAEIGGQYKPSSFPSTKDIPGGEQAEKFLTDPLISYEDEPITDSLRTGAEWMIGAGRKLIDKGAKIAPDVIAGITSIIGKNIDEHLNEDGTPKDSWFELVLGLGGTIGGMFMGRAPKDLSKSEGKAVDYVKSLTGDAPSPLELDDVANAKAKLWNDPNTVIPELKDEVADAQKMIAEKLRQGEIGTLGDLSESPNLQVLEASADPLGKTGKALKEVSDARQRQASEQILDTFGPGVAKDAPKLVKSQLTKARQKGTQAAKALTAKESQKTSQELAESVAIEQKAVSQADVAARQADEVEALVKTDVRPSQASKRFAEGYKSYEDWVTKTLVKPAWKVFDDGPPIEIKEIQMAVKNAVEDLPKTEADFLVEKYGKLLKKIEEMEVVTHPKELQTVLSRVKASINEASVKGGYGPDEKQLDTISRGIDNFLRSPFGGQGFKEAVDITKEVKTKVGANTKLAKARLNNETETFIKRLGIKEEEGQALFDIMNRTESPALVKRLEDVIRSKASAPNVGINQKFLDDYDEILSNFPKLREELASVVKAKGTATELATVGKEAVTKETGKRSVLAKALKDKKKDIQDRADGLRNTMLKQDLYKFSEDPGAIVDKVLGGKYNDRQLRELVAQMKLSGADEAFKKAVGESLVKKVMPKKSRVTTVQQSSLDDFDEMSSTLVDMKIITKKQSEEIAESIQRGESVLRKTRGREQIPELLGDKSFEASLGTAAVLKPIKAANSLIFANAVRRTLKKKLEERAKDPDFVKFVQKFLANPSDYLEAVGKVDNAAEATKAASNVMKKIMIAYQATDKTTDDGE